MHWTLRFLLGALLGVLVAMTWQYARADESTIDKPKPEASIEPLPVVCMKKEFFQQIMDDSPMFIVWHGVQEHFVYSIWETVSDGHWTLTMEAEDNKLICILGYVQQHELTGQEARN